MSAVVFTLKRTLLVQSIWPVVAVAVLSAWVGTWLATHSLGADEGFLEEVRHGSMLFAALLTLSLAEPLQTSDEVRSGQLMLRHAKGGGFALPARWAGLSLSLLPVMALAALAAGGLPSSLAGLIGQVGVLVAGGLALGAFLERKHLVPALWCLAILGQLRPWLATLEGSAAWSWVVPDLGSVGSGVAWLHGLCWALGVLAIAQGRLTAVSAR